MEVVVVYREILAFLLQMATVEAVVVALTL
jgi:hypothetical protein